MLGQTERDEIGRLWARKLQQDAQKLSRRERHRNLEPASAEFVSALAEGIGAKRILEIGGSSGISTIALASVARNTSGRLTSIEIEPARQSDARETISRLGLGPFVDFILGDAASFVSSLKNIQFALIDSEKEDYIRFFDMLHMDAGGVIVADNIISHALADYVAHVRSRPGVESITLPVGQGLEVTRIVEP